MRAALCLKYTPNERGKDIDEATIVALRCFLAVFAAHALGIEPKWPIDILDRLPRCPSFMNELRAAAVVAAAFDTSEFEQPNRVPQ